MKKRALVLALAVLPVLVAVGVAAASGLFRDARNATERFQDVDAAIAAGYSFRLPELSGATCIVQPGQGGMGVHMVNTSLLDGTIDATKPEALVYDETSQGRLKLAALEYVVFESAWAGPGKPTLFGQEFDYTPAGNRYGLPAFYALHAWVWRGNPSGILSAWNPRIDCK
jgi:hypothetical protein